MPAALLHACPGDGGRCSELVEHGRCKRHQRQQEQRRGSAASRGYDWRWTQFSRRWLARWPLCGMRADGQLHAENSRCVRAGIVTQAQCTNHIDGHSRADDRETFMNADRLESLCLACNSLQAIEREGGFGR